MADGERHSGSSPTGRRRAFRGRLRPARTALLSVFAFALVASSAVQGTAAQHGSNRDGEESFPVNKQQDQNRPERHSKQGGVKSGHSEHSEHQEHRGNGNGNGSPRSKGTKGGHGKQQTADALELDRAAHWKAVSVQGGNHLELAQDSSKRDSSSTEPNAVVAKQQKGPPQAKQRDETQQFWTESERVWDRIREEDRSAGEYEAPRNVSGTYRGYWSKVRFDDGLKKIRLLKKQSGVVIFELRTLPLSEPGMHSVEGDLVIRDGAYVTDNDVRMRLHGIYVSDANRLNAILEPLPAIRVDITEKDRADGNAFYRQALREAAKDWRTPASRRAAGMSPAQSLARLGGEAPLAAPQLRLRKKCEFHLELRPAVVPGPEPVAQMPPPIAGSAMTVPVSLVGTWLPLSKTSQQQQSQEAVQRAVADIIMNGTLVSDNCGMVISINATYVRLEEYYAKAVNYTLMITIISFLQVLLLIRQMESTNTQATAAKVSLLSVGVQAIMDAYLCLLHLTAGIVVEALFNAFATVAFFEFVIFAIFEMRYLLSIWRARRPNMDEGAPGARRELSILYTRFYGALLVVIFFAYQLQHYMRSIIFILYSFWLPQIVHCVREDVKQPLKPLYIIGVSATRLALPLYLFGCPKNMLRISTSPALCAALIAWVAFQALVLMLQSRFGPRCFIPKCFLPPRYDYHHPATPFGDDDQCGGDEETGEGSVECVICMAPVEVGRPEARMVTPCNHFFHSGCLQRWMDVKMECPTCRRVLPPP